MYSFIKSVKKLIKSCDCDNECNAIRFKQNFKNWTSGNNDINKFIQNTQLSNHKCYRVKNALEWIPYDRIYDVKYIAEDDKFGKVYRANWIDGFLYRWDNESQDWERVCQNMFVILKILNNPTSITSKYIDKITVSHRVYGITQDPETKNYMVALNDICEKCNKVCNSIRFQQNFKNWTSGNYDVDKFIQDTQLPAHDDVRKVLEWIPYDRLYDVKYIAKDYEFGKVYGANWIDGFINIWDYESENWKRRDQNMFVILKILNNPASITSKYIDKIAVPYKVFGIAQDLEIRNYMVVLDFNKCGKCDVTCNSIHFQRNFKNWTSDSNDINKFIQDTQLSAHVDAKEALEWIPYDRLYDIKYITDDDFGKVYRTNWIDGCIDHYNNEDYVYDEIYYSSLDNNDQNWRRKDQNMFVILKLLNNPASITSEFINKTTVPHKVYGITQDPETKNYMVVLNDVCEKCNEVCNSIHFQRNFKNWTSDSKDINKFIQDTQLLAHVDAQEALEWIPYDRLYDIKYIAEDDFGKVYKANWIDGCIDHYNNEDYMDDEIYYSSLDINNQNWKRKDQNMFVILRLLNNPASITSEFINKTAVPYKVYGITQDPETKIYMVVLDFDKCGKCDVTCNSIRFQQNFKNWSSGNNDIDKFIQDTQLSVHVDAKEALEWIPYDRLYDVKYIAKGGFGKVYRARWIDGYADDYNQNWERKMVVALKSLNNSKNITLEFMNEITLHYKLNLHKCIIKFYGITQDPETQDYIMVLDYAENGNLRNYLDTSYNELSWNDKFNYLHSIAHGLKDMHENELIHRDLHIGNILRLKSLTCITDLGLCRPADCNALKNTKNSIYGVLPLKF